ncbi:MAG: acyl-CoA dehydratase activase-related protein [candidate division WOR-3 bacterium]|nr:acyl-CoA dehydratase activase-related protein [candidate division WOR-3 bacterium]
MKSAFAYMGNIYIPLRTFFKELGIELIVPPPPNNKTLKLGIQYAPETMCIPFKLTLGNIIVAMKMGADTILHTTGFWSCRFGYFGKLYAYIVKDLGYKFNHIDVSLMRLKEHYQLVKKLNKNSDHRTMLSFIKAFSKAWYKSSIMEFMEKTAREIRPFEINKGEVSKILAKYLTALDNIDSIKDMNGLKKQFVKEIETVPKDLSRPILKIKIVGESFCVIEPFVNFNLIQTLGEQGIFVDPFLTAHKWLGFHTIRNGRREWKSIEKLASSYWKYNVGGEDKKSVGYTLLAPKQGFDGVIFLHPFGCMSSNAVQPVLHKISQQHNIPLLDIGLDEHTAETGFYNRIDAFISILANRRKIHRK